MARIRKPHGCYYQAVNILHSWGNTVYLTNDLRIIIKDISSYFDDEKEIKFEGKTEYQKADCCPLTCNITKPKWHDEFNYQIYDKQHNYTD